jgi:hypothetical protein
MQLSRSTAHRSALRRTAGPYILAPGGKLSARQQFPQLLEVHETRSARLLEAGV